MSPQTRSGFLPSDRPLSAGSSIDTDHYWRYYDAATGDIADMLRFQRDGDVATRLTLANAK
jgi:hypothetical protein